ncbi:hypothetical protein [Solibacillus sp. FSL K6-1523]|uniref:hypothetical protein n=1 Tax=Solibacillus sp. FSL K6-1523 TaxID=2921471 RepID=UPI0030FB51EC
MTDRELLEQILTKVNKIGGLELSFENLSTKVEHLSNKVDNLEQSNSEINMKIDALTNQVVLLSEDMTIVKEQTAVNAELRPEVSDAVSRIDAIEMDLKIMKKVITS